jgi:uncharacterized protein DUF4037
VDLESADWLVVPQQKLLEVTAGRVYYDGLGELGKARAKLAYYLRDAWLYLLAAQWRRVGQQEAFLGRTGEAGDELGSRLIAAALVCDLMGLCFLMGRRYAPYAKWFGTAFSGLRCAPRLGPVLEAVLRAGSWEKREGRLSEAYAIVAGMHHALGLTPPLGTGVSRYHDRPLLRIPHRAGSLDQICDSTDVLAHPDTYLKLRGFFE